VGSVSVPENVNSTVLATLKAVDPDRSQQHIFTVVNSNLFFTAGDKLQVQQNL
jgi:hypothetical protein